MENVRIHEPISNIDYNFEFHNWFSQITDDKKHIRTAFVKTANFIPKIEHKEVAVMKNYVLNHEVKVVKEIDIEPPNTAEDFTYDKNMYQTQKSLTTSIQANVSSTSSSSKTTRTESSSSASSVSSTPRDNIPKPNYVEKLYLTSSSSSSTPREPKKILGRKLSNTSTQSSSSAVEIQRPQIEVQYLNHQTRSRTPSTSSSSTTVTKQNESESSMSNSSSTTITPKEKVESKSSNRNSERKIAAIGSHKSVVRRPPSSESNSNSKETDGKLKHDSDSSSVKSELAKITKYERINTIQGSQNNNISNLILKVEETKESAKIDRSDTSSDSSSSTSSSSSSSKSSKSSISVVNYVKNKSLSPDAEQKLNDLSEKAFKFLSQNDLENLKQLINESSKIILSKNSNEETLLAAACKIKCNNEIVEFLVRTDDMLITIDTPDGNLIALPVLFYALVKKKNINTIQL